MKKIISTLTCFLMVITSAMANNVLVSNVSISNQNTGADYSMINFDVTWDNSWRTNSNEANYDGVWLFIKFRKTNSGFWEHATMNYASPGTAAACGHTQATGSTVRTPSDGKGVWIYRSGQGSGNVNFNNISLRWNYGVDGVLDNDSVELRVYALEMVYVTPGQFYLGSGGTENGAFRDGSSTNPYLVTSENAINIGSTPGNLNYTLGGYQGDGLGPIPAAFPKGYNAFWVMKYEASEQQYVDFLNALDANKANNRNMGYAGTPNNFVAANPERAAAGLSPADHTALLDWAALRPMTEMEYEKACRGYNMAPVANEYAWGNTTLVPTVSVYDPGAVNEKPVEGNATYYPFAAFLNRPIRCGAYANDTTLNRTQTGGTYYGAMEMSGNLEELIVSAGASAGRAYTGTHGDGYLDPNGDANAPTWDNAAIGYKGGYFSDQYLYLRVSDRYYTSYFSVSGRSVAYGSRGCRTAE